MHIYQQRFPLFAQPPYSQHQRSWNCLEIYRAQTWELQEASTTLLHNLNSAFSLAGNIIISKGWRCHLDLSLCLYRFLIDFFSGSQKILAKMVARVGLRVFNSERSSNQFGTSQLTASPVYEQSQKYLRLRSHTSLLHLELSEHQQFQLHAPCLNSNIFGRVLLSTDCHSTDFASCEVSSDESRCIHHGTIKNARHSCALWTKPTLTILFNQRNQWANHRETHHTVATKVAVRLFHELNRRDNNLLFGGSSWGWGWFHSRLPEPRYGSWKSS